MLMVEDFCTRPAAFSIEVAGMKVNYDSHEPCEWFGGRNYGAHKNALKEAFHQVMYYVGGSKTSQGQLVYRDHDWNTGSFVVGNGDTVKTWRVDRRSPNSVLNTLKEIKAWLASEGVAV